MSFNELVRAISGLGLEIPLTHVAEIYYQVFDKDANGRVTFDEFCDKLAQWDAAHPH